MPGAEQWPNTFIVGAMRCGTTTLYHHLRAHPDVFMSRVKEPHYFSDYQRPTWGPDGPLPGEEAAYLDLFTESGDAKVVGEASTSYLTDPKAPGRIADAVSQARFLVSLRDPVERAHSQFFFGVRTGAFEGSFESHLPEDLEAAARRDSNYGYVHQGMFAGPLETYIRTFGRDHVHVLTLEDLSDQPIPTLQEVARFLGIDPEPMERVDHDLVYNRAPQVRNRVTAAIRESQLVYDVARRLIPARARRWLDENLLLDQRERPPVSAEARMRLAELYRPEVERVEELLGRSMPNLRRSWPEELR